MPAKKQTAKKTTRKKNVKTQTIEQENRIIQDNFASDRVIRPRSNKNIECPECGTFPTITKIRRKDYELRRCRECGHRWEIKGDAA